MLPSRLFRFLTCCLVMAPMVMVSAQIVGTSPYTHIGGGLFINEMSNGAVGTVQEYVELIVTGDPNNPTAPVDLTGWVIDDNNEDQGAVGTATGHFTLGACYNAVPPGSMLVIYNATDLNPLVPPADPTDANGDGVYIIPQNSPCLTACNSNPSATNNQYCPCASPGPASGWLIGMANGGDMIQLRDLCGNVVHAISFLLAAGAYSPEVAASPFLLQSSFNSQSGRVIFQENAVSEDWNLLSNFMDAPITGMETPGIPNNANNAAMIAAIAAGTFPYGGHLNNCYTNAGLLVVPPDSPDPVPTIQICQGQDLAAFSTDFSGADPASQGYTFGYAYLLTTNTAPYTILQFNSTGNFNLAGLSAGNYIVWGFSYFQITNTPNVTAFLTNSPGFANIAALQAYTGCGYTGDLTFFADNNDTMTLQVVMNTLTVDNIVVTCGSTNGVPTYVVSFQINGGDAGNYSVTGGNGGIVTGNNFTSFPINDGTAYSFTINDGGACGPITINGNPDCGCVTNVGSIDLSPINNCINEPAVVIHSVPPVLDGNDVLVYILHTSPAIFPPGTILAWSYTPTFSFNPGTMTPGVTYYIHALAGDASAATGVNLADLCLSFAGPISVTWFNPPTASISGNLQVCLGQSTSFNVNFTGNGPFTFTYTANGTPFSVTTSSNPYVLTVSPTVSTTYQLTAVSDANCSGTVSGAANATVVVGPTASIGNTPVVACPGETTQIPVSFTGFGPFSLTYTANGNPVTIVTSANPYNITVSPAITTTYILTNINAGGCPGFVSGAVVVNVTAAPTASLSGGGVVCPGGSADLEVNFTGTGPFTFTYTGNGINPQTVTTFNNPYSFSVSPATSTFYQITSVSDAACSNTSIASQTVVVLSTVTAILSGSPSPCSSINSTLTVDFTGTGPYTFSYTANGGPPITVNTTFNPYSFTVNPTVMTTYELISVSNGSCTGTASGTAVVTVGITDVVVYLMPTLCSGGSLIIDGAHFDEDNPIGTVVLPHLAANGCDSIVHVNLSHYPPVVYNLSQTLCFGQSITVGSTVFNQANPMGTEVLSGASYHGCDSTVIVTLTFTNATINNLAPTICPGSSITVNGTIFNQANPSGSVTIAGGSVSGCDSIVNVSLSFYPPAVNNLSQALCSGQSLTVGTTVFNQANPSGTVILPGATIHGCDSIVNVNLVFTNAAVNNINSTLCPGGSISVGATVFNQANPSGSVTFTGGSVSGCDSIVNVSLSFYPSAVNNLNQTLCFGQSITVGSTVFTQANPSGTVVLPGTTIHGCDSTVNVNLAFTNAAVNNINSNLCPGGSISVGATVFNQANPSGSVTFTGGSVSGCDSIVNVSLSFYPSSVNNLNQTLCFGQSLTVGSTVFTQANPSGTVLLPGATIHGCDSIVNVNLVFTNAAVNNISSTLCPGGSISVGATVFNQANPSGSVTFPGGSVSGCDSIVNVSLAFFPPAAGVLTDTLCQNDFLIVGSTVFNQSNPSGVAMLAGASLNGCDSTVAVSLVFINCNPGCNTFAGTMPADTLVVCEGDGILMTINEGNEILDPNDALIYILHEFPGNINPVLATSPTGTFDMSGLISCHLYYVSAVAGNDSGNGTVDLLDPCLSISNPQPVVVVEVGPPVFIDETVTEICPPVVICGTSGTISACEPDLSGIIIPPIPICQYDHDTLFIPGFDIIDTIGGWSVQGMNVIQSGDTFFVAGDTIVFSDLFNQVTDVVAFGGSDSVLNYTFIYQWPEYIVIANGLLDTIVGPKCMPQVDINIDVFSSVNVTFDIISLDVSDGFLTCIVPCNELSVVVSGGQSPFTINPGTSIIACNAGSFCADVTDALGCVANDCGNVLEDILFPVAFITGNLEVCPGGLTTLTAQGCPSCSVQWTFGPTTPSVLVGVGDYIAFVTDNINGCTSVAIATVTETSLISSNITEDLCQGESITIHGVVFSESNPSGTITIPGLNGACDTVINVNCTILPPAVYDITQTLCIGQSITVNGTLYDQNNPTGVEFLPGMSFAGCDSTIFINLAFYPPAILDLQQTLCPGQAITIGNQVFNEANPTGTVILPNAAVSGCDSLVNVNLIFGNSTFGSLTDTLCPGESIAIGTEQFDQDHPTGSVIFPGGGSGGCDSVLNVSISFFPVIEAGLSGDASICAGDSTPLVLHLTDNVVADIVYNSFVWGSQVLSGVSDGYTFLVAPGQSDTYYIVAINIPGYNCTPVITQGAVVQVSNLALTTEIESDFNGFSVSCYGAADGSASVAVSGGVTPYSYQWSNGSTTPMATGLTAGMIFVTVSDAAGCSHTDSLLLMEPLPLNLDATATAPFCYGDLNGSILVGGGEGSVPVQSYSLDGVFYQAVDSLPFEIPFLGSGLYELSVLDDNGCVSVMEITIPSPVPPSVELGEDIFLTLGDSVLLTAQVNFNLDTATWSPMDYLRIKDLLDVVSTPLETVLYTITVTDANGCIATDALTVFVENTKSVFVPNVFSPNNDGINDILTIFAYGGQLKEINSFAIYDRWGNEVFHATHFQPNDFQVGWDGKYRGEPMDPAVFGWFAEVVFIDGTVSLFKGDITLVR